MRLRPKKKETILRVYDAEGNCTGYYHHVQTWGVGHGGCLFIHLPKGESHVWSGGTWDNFVVEKVVEGSAVE